MSLSIGIVGLPNVGKSTLFNALTKNDILAANYPFATIEPNTGIVPVPDERLQKLSKLYNNAPIVPAAIEFVDIAGLVAGASKGEGLGNQFLANIRECAAIIHVVRAFESGDIVHVNNTIHPKNDIEVINTELYLADITSLEKQLPKLQKEAKANPKLKPKLTMLEEIKAALESGNTNSITNVYKKFNSEPESAQSLKQLQLISAKPAIYVFNVDEDTLSDQTKQAELAKLVAPADSICINAQIESELKDMDETEAKELLETFGQTQSGLSKVIHAAYHTLGLQSFLTAGEKEVRAWTIKQGSTAPEAAGVIHGDFEHGFIAAQVVDYADLIAAGSEAAARSAGKIRTEGKTYIMQPNDVVEFRFNV